MQVIEVFYSLQGEGLLEGMPSVFIRLSGCPIRCHWCDTQYAWAWDAGVDMDLKSIMTQLARWHCRHVVITGGEPLIGPDGRGRTGMVELTGTLKQEGYHITIETSGLICDAAVHCDLMSISPKPGHVYIDTIRSLIQRYEHQLKFLVPKVWQVDRVMDLVDALGIKDRSRVMLMPLARSRDEIMAIQGQVAQACLENGLRFCQRLQVLLWDGGPGR